jgi:hypothetical protein
MPAGFPNIELRHRYTIAAPGSGSLYLDNLFFRQLPAPAGTNWSALVPFGSSWRYTVAAPRPNWFAAGFDDSTWLQGNAKFGAGSGPTIVVTVLPPLLPNYFFRKKFVLSNTNIEEFLFAAICTDVTPLRVFINGTEVKSSIDTVTLAGNETRYFDLTPFTSLLQPGTNTVAVQLPNTWGTDYDNIAFDVSLRAVVYRPNLPALKLQRPTSSPPTLTVEAPAGTVWQLQSSDGLSPPGWQLMQVLTNPAAGMQSLQDTGQNGRKPPTSVRCRVYRLMPY